MSEPSAASWRWNPRRQGWEWTPAWYELLGYREDEVRPSTARAFTLVHADDHGAFRRALADGEAGRGADLEVRLRRGDGSYGVYQLVVEAEGPPDVRLVVLRFAEAARPRWQGQVHGFLPDLWRGLAESDPAFIWAMGRDGSFAWTNPAWREITGMTAEVAPWRELAQHIVAEDRERLTFFLLERLGDRRRYPVLFRVRRGDGELRHLRASVRTSVSLGEGLPTLLVTAVDVSELLGEENALRQHLAERDVLLRELHHRVKNNFLIISTMLRKAARELTGETGSAAVEEVLGRVETISLVHDKLHRSPSGSEVLLQDFLRELATRLHQASQAPGQAISLVLNLQPVRAQADSAIALGLVMNELVTNAFKHAFAGRPQGCLTVELRQPVPQELVLAVQDDGPGLPAGFDIARQQSSGLGLVDKLTRSLRGRVEVVVDGGTLFRIVVPWSA